MKPLISIIVPIYNVENYLQECIESLLIQTYRNLEILLINDGSTDDSGNICDEYAKCDSRISIVHKENGGLSDARNVGMKVASGEYYMFIDSDDYISHDLVEKINKRLFVLCPIGSFRTIHQHPQFKVGVGEFLIGVVKIDKEIGITDNGVQLILIRGLAD